MSSYTNLMKALPHEAHYRGFVVGFYFSEDLQQVLLIKKTHPEFQAGKLNGVGGKIENGESHQAAMNREFHEEAGVDVRSWWYLGAFDAGGQPGHVFYQKGDLSKCFTNSDEEIVIFGVELLDDVLALESDGAVYSFVPGVLEFIQAARKMYSSAN